MPLYHPSDIANILGCKAEIINNDPVSYLLTDSRRLIHAEKSIFFAITGIQHDGHKYVGELLEAGIKNFVVEGLPDEKLKTKANFYVVKNSITALQTLAMSHREKFKYPVIGITGSNGKTIVKEWIFNILSSKKDIVRNPRSYNSQIGVPLSVWNMEEGYNMAVFEAGISMKNEMEKLEKIIRPDIGIFTNIGDAHQENFPSLKEKTGEKIKLFKNSSVLIYCRDYKEIHEAVNSKTYNKKIKFFTWSRLGDADLLVLSEKPSQTGTVINSQFNNQEVKIEIPFSDKGSIENAISILCLILHLGLFSNEITEGFKSLPSVEMRLEQKQGINNCTLINDSYNSDLNSLSIAIDFLNQQDQHKNKTIVLSDILQSGLDKKQLYTNVANLLKEKNISKLIGIGPQIFMYKDLFTMNSVFYESTNDFISFYNPGNFNNESILLKGSRIFQFEKIHNILELKKHRTGLHINMDALVHNLNYFRSLLKPGTKIMAMVKALGYGSGTYEIVNLLKFHRVDYLGVAYIDEGIDLRKAGVNLPVMVLNPDVNNMDQLVEYNLEPSLFSREVFEKFEIALLKRGEKEYPCHIKIDTGMHRLGFMEKDISWVIPRIKASNIIKVKGIFTHLAATDDPAFDDSTGIQLQRFENIVDKITNAISYPVIKHALNSSGIKRFKYAHFDMVRLGIGLYGFSASSGDELKNVFTLKTTLSQIKMLKKGETVGYNPKEKLKQDTKIGIIAVGYADGYNRKLGNGIGKVIIKNKFATVIGNICMDMCMIDLTGIDNVNEGDEVIVFGDQWPASEIAKQLGTIPYEVVTTISERIKRVYFKE